jgi:hypothetical protein
MIFMWSIVEISFWPTAGLSHVAFVLFANANIGCGGRKFVAGVWDEETILVSPTVHTRWFETDDCIARSWIPTKIRHWWPGVLRSPGERSQCCHQHTRSLFVQLYTLLEKWCSVIHWVSLLVYHDSFLCGHYFLGPVYVCHFFCSRKTETFLMYVHHFTTFYDISPGWCYCNYHHDNQ